MRDGDITFGSPFILMFDLDDFFLRPQGRVEKATHFLLEKIGLGNVSLDLLMVDPEAIRTVEKLGIDYNFAVYVLVHGTDRTDAAKKRLEDVWISRFLHTDSLKGIRDILREYRILWYFSSVVPSAYHASVDGVEPFTSWKDISVKRM